MSEDERIGVIMLIAIGVSAVVMLVPVIFYLLSLHQAMDAIDEQNRPLPGGLAWLSLLPCLGVIWLGVFVILLSTALDRELVRRQLPADAGALGIAFGVVALLMAVPYLNILVMLPFLVLWIIHWVKTADIKNKLRSSPF